MKTVSMGQGGFTLVELTISLFVFAMIAVSLLGLFISLVDSTVIVKHRAVALTLATNQIEYLKSLPYDSLAVAGGSIYSASPLPASSVKTLNGAAYTIKTSINYIDDAYDGCASYPTQALKQLYCRNYPPPAGAPAVDSNPQDYKGAHVTVTDRSNAKLAEVDTEISARVSETASATGALFVVVLDSTGSPVSGAMVSVTNSTVSPAVNVSDDTDVNGTAIFYGLPPDNRYDYQLTAAKSGYSSLTSIMPSGSLQPVYPNQKILTQQSSYATLTIKAESPSSLVVETTDTAGTLLPVAKIYAKGGYKKYTSSTDSSYYYDNQSPSDTRPTTDSSGLAALSNLVPGSYIFCGDSGATGCSVGGTTYYLAAAVPYGGSNPFSPITVPIYGPSAPPATTYPYNSVSYLQKVRLLLTTKSNFPRIMSLTPGEASKAAAGISSFGFTLSGANLPCSATASSCATTVSLLQNATTYPASCTGSSAGTQLSCTVNLSGAAVGGTQLVIGANGYSFTLPASPLLGGINVTS